MQEINTSPNSQNKNNYTSEKSAEINPIKIIAIDGTTASGKGSLARKLAAHLGYHYLNSGALYRLTAYTLKQKGFDFEKYNTLRKEREVNIMPRSQDQIETTLTETSKISSTKIENKINENNGPDLIGNNYIEDPEYIIMENMVVDAAKELSPIFSGKEVIVNGIDIWPIISTQEYGNYAARISPTLRLREALYLFQRSCIKTPGLVAEGRDMTSEVYTDAICKIFLDASPECRTKRRLRDEILEESGKDKTFESVLAEIHDRDTKDRNRHHGALKLTTDSFYLDNTDMSQEDTLEKSLIHFNKV